jgi:hypothetical protein
MFKSNHSSNLVRLLSLLFLFSCSSPTDVNYLDSVYIAGTPVIKGYYVTTNENPDGLGEYVGSPQYDPAKGNAFPNPYIEDPTIGATFEWRFITFIHLPPTTTKIFIVKGISQEELTQTSHSYFGISAFNNSVNIVKEINKLDSSPFARWDFRDENGIIYREGYFRAYIFGKDVAENTFVDFYISLGPDIIEHF